MAKSTDYVVKFSGQNNIKGTIQEVKRELQEVGNSGAQASDKITQKFQKIVNSSAPLKRQLRDLQTIMAEMNMKGLSNTGQFQEIARYAGTIKDAISDANQAVQKFSSDTGTLDAVKEGFTGLTGAVSVATGAMNLFGVENKEVQQALLKVQSVMLMLNGVQAIANTLNKDSALMLKLKSTFLTTNTVAETANTTATAANSAATGVNTAQQVANTAATKASTIAQLGLNKAVLANPYVLAAAAIAGLVAGIAAWVSSMSEATEEEAALTAATEAFNEQVDSQMKKAGEQISAFMNMKKTYEENADNVQVLTEKILNNKEAQRKLGVQLKTVDDIQKFVVDHADDYIQACIARANAAAVEAARTAILTKVLSELSKTMTKLMAGEEVNFTDVRDILKEIGLTTKAADELLRGTLNRHGGTDKFDFWGKNDLVIPTDEIDSWAADIMQTAIEALDKQGAGKPLNEMLTKFVSEAEIAEFNYGKVQEDNDKASRSIEKHADKVSKHSEKTKEEIKQILTTLEGCDAIIQSAESQMKKLDRTSANYATELKKLEGIVRATLGAKLLLIDKDSLEGLKQYKSTVEAIIQRLPKGAETISQWRTELENVTKEIEGREIELGIKVDPEITKKEKFEKSVKDIEEQFSKIEFTPKFSSFEMATGKISFDTNTLDGIEQMMDFNDNLISQLETLKTKLQELGAEGTAAYEQITTAIQNTTAANEELADKAGNKSSEKKRLEDRAEAWGYYSEMIRGTADAMTVLGDSQDAQVAKFAVNTAAILANAVSTIAAMNAEALAKGASSAFSLPFPANLAAWATVFTTITSIFASLPKFADGGIVEGPTSGDHVLARLNGNEMVFNARQQSNLFRAIDSGVFSFGNNQNDIFQVDWRIKGSDLYGVMRNFGKSQAKTGKKLNF